MSYTIDILEEENKQLQMKIETARGTLQLLTDLLNQRNEKLEAIRNWALNLRNHGGQVGSIQQVSYANQILEVLSDE